MREEVDLRGHEVICGYCGRPWDEIDDPREPCAKGKDVQTGRERFIGPHRKRVVRAPSPTTRSDQ